MTTQVELLTVENHFSLRPGLAIYPDLPCAHTASKTIQTEARVITPTGKEFVMPVCFSLTQFKTKSDGYRMVPIFPSAKKNDIPIGSKVMVNKNIFDLFID